MKICTNCVIPETAETLTFAKEGGKCSVCNNSDQKKEIDWEPKVDVMDGLKETIDYFKAEIK